VAVAGFFVYRSYFSADSVQNNTHPQPPGWSDLISCSSTVSIDGARSLDLGVDHSANVTEFPPEQSKDVKVKRTSGTWSYDETAKQYSITITGETANYLLLSQDSMEGCILVKGSFDNANLRESWFSSREDDAQDDSDEPEHEP